MVFAALAALLVPAWANAANSLQKGACFAGWQQELYSSQGADESLEQLAAAGATHVAIVVTRYQENFDSTDIIQNESTPSDESILHAAKKARATGLKVMIKPHIDVINIGPADNVCWRADIGFYDDGDWDKWFKGYKYFILHYAELAAEAGADIFCVGTELSFAAQKTDRWIDLISEVRKVFPGKLVYAANWDNYRNIGFWDALDYAGIDAYFPLSYRKNPSVTELVLGWEKWKNDLRNFYRAIKKPIIFTEIGYASTPDAAMTPWKGGETGNPDLEIQKRCYEAFFHTMWGCPWLKGAYFWRWAPSPYAGGENNRQFTPQNKPALEVLKKYYSQQP